MKKILLLFFLLLLVACTSTEITTDAEQQVEEETQQVTVLETPEEALARQVEIVSETTNILMQDITVEGPCDIELSTDTIYGDETVDITISFEDGYEKTTATTSCDQFERYGISGDDLFEEALENNKITFTCDYGLVTTPTIYFISAIDGEEDLCVAPLTVIPYEEDTGTCFSEETLENMKADCMGKGFDPYTIQDANNCDTVYCGFSETVCPSEERLLEEEEACAAEGNTPLRYSEMEENLDFPCAYLRCSSCPSAEDLLAEEQQCEELGLETVQEVDEETGCTYAYCTLIE